VVAELSRQDAKEPPAGAVPHQHSRHHQLDDPDAPGWSDEGVFGGSPAMRAVKELINRAAGTNLTVLVWGESGVGKEIVTRALHARWPGRQCPFVKVNCAALPLELLESELFGYERGAFTGAYRAKPGKFELADNGTIFLDEIGEMPSPIQAKLLQVLQDGQFSRLGSRKDIQVNVRVVAATNRDLVPLVEQGKFREDLYYRLNVINIHVPPLRERREEIPGLVVGLLEKFCKQYGLPLRYLTDDIMGRLLAYHWPGNVRELENVVKRIAVLGTGEETVQELFRRPPRPAAPAPPGEPPGSHPHEVAEPAIFDERIGLKEIVRRAELGAEAAALTHVLNRVRWNRTEAARRLKISYKTLLLKMKRHGLGARGGDDAVA
jgi:two-component system, NtrC family, response regulator AtoC